MSWLKINSLSSDRTDRRENRLRVLPVKAEKMTLQLVLLLRQRDDNYFYVLIGRTIVRICTEQVSWLEINDSCSGPSN